MHFMLLKEVKTMIDIQQLEAMTGVLKEEQKEGESFWETALRVLKEHKILKDENSKLKASQTTPAAEPQPKQAEPTTPVYKFKTKEEIDAGMCALNYGAQWPYQIDPRQLLLPSLYGSTPTDPGEQAALHRIANMGANGMGPFIRGNHSIVVTRAMFDKIN